MSVTRHKDINTLYVRAKRLIACSPCCCRCPCCLDLNEGFSLDPVQYSLYFSRGFLSFSVTCLQWLLSSILRFELLSSFFVDEDTWRKQPTPAGTKQNTCVTHPHPTALSSPSPSETNVFLKANTYEPFMYAVLEVNN